VSKLNVNSGWNSGPSDTGGSLFDWEAVQYHVHPVPTFGQDGNGKEVTYHWPIIAFGNSLCTSDRYLPVGHSPTPPLPPRHVTRLLNSANTGVEYLLACKTHRKIILPLAAKDCP
jgi:hypothetical protein